MYQSIDEETLEDEGGRGWLGPLLLAGIAGAAVLAAVYLSSPGRHAQADPIGAEPEARADYLRALSEPRAALRRARLTDFINRHPQDSRLAAAQSQLAIIEVEEARAWQAVVGQVYDAKLLPEEKRAALEGFRNEWAGYLGSRDEDLETLLTELSEDAAPIERPDRALPDQPSPFADSGVPTDQLAGAPRSVQRPIIVAPPRPIVRPQPPRQTAVITPPKVRRNVTPRYPRKAMRRGISGIVVLALDIDERGRVSGTEVLSVEAERYGDDFVRAAERAAMRTRFHPKTVDGQPAEALGVTKRYRFESSR